MHGGTRQTMVSVVCRVMGLKSSRRLTGPISKVSFHGIANTIRPGLFRSALLAAASSFWFARFAFHPETEVFSADNAGAD